MSESELKQKSHHVKKGKRAKQRVHSSRQSTDILEMQGKTLKCIQSKPYYKSKAVS